MTSKKENLFIKIPTSVVRNEDFYISNDEFILYAWLCFLHFRNYRKEKLEVDHKILKSFCLISDPRTLRKRLMALYKVGLILTEVTKLPTKGKLTLEMNDDYFKEGVIFTKLSVKIFSHYNNAQADTQNEKRIDEYAFRQIFYYKSHINTKMKDRDRSFCFVGFDTLIKRLKIGKTKIKEANDQLVKAELLEIKRHKLGHDDNYNDADELIFDRYNNHYYVDSSLF